MNKKEFLGFLEKRLAVLDKTERNDILAEFDWHITNKIANGADEETAIADFGDPEIFVEEILDAYKIDPEYDKASNQSQNAVGGFLKNFSNAVNAIAEGIFNKSKKEFFGILIKLLIIIGVLALISIPVNMAANMISQMFAVFGSGIYGFFSTIIHLIINLLFIMLVVYTIYIFIAKTFLNNSEYKSYSYSESEKKQKNRKEKKHMDKNCDSNAFKEENNTSTGQGTENHGKDFKSKISESQILSDIKERGHIFIKEKKENQSDESSFVKALTFFLKILIVIILIPTIIYTICNIIGLVISAIAMFMGLPTIGITVAALGSLLCVGSFLVAVYYAAFTKSGGKPNTEPKVTAENRKAGE